MGYRSTLEFLLYNWLQAEGLQQRPRFAGMPLEAF